MSAVADYLEEQAGALLEQACVPRAVHLPGNIPDAYCAQTLAAAPAAVRHTALARLIAAAAPQQKMSLVPEADALLAKGEGAVQLCEGVWLSIRQGLLAVGPRPEPPRGEAGSWRQPFAPGVFAAPGGLLVEVQLVNYEKMVNSEKDVRNLLKFCADYGKIQDNPCFRTRRPGDMFRPAGRGVTKPLKKAVFRNKGCLPRRVTPCRCSPAEAQSYGRRASVLPKAWPRMNLQKAAVTVTARQMEEVT